MENINKKDIETLKELGILPYTLEELQYRAEKISKNEWYSSLNEIAQANEVIF